MAEQPMEAPAPKAAPQPEPEPARSSGLSPVELESGRALPAPPPRSALRRAPVGSDARLPDRLAMRAGVPFQRTDLTWGSICSSISNMWGSDLNARETMLNWLVVAILVATSVLKCWSLATEVCENTFQDVSSAPPACPSMLQHAPARAGPGRALGLTSGAGSLLRSWTSSASRRRSSGASG